jgi:excinuclease ABC subunit C
MAQPNHLEHSADFTPERAQEVLRGVPELPGVFALYGPRPQDEDTQEAQPYLTRTANLRRRLAPLLAPPEAVGEDGQPVLSKRLNLRERVARIAWSVTGSEFESMLVLYRATAAQFGVEAARKRLRLRTPFFVRLTIEHRHPRLYVTNRLSARGLAQSYGPFASRVAAERYADSVLDLFQLRRCYEDLAVHPEHPGCVYGEMKRCMAPCNLTATAEQYNAEAQAVERFLATRGESLLAEVARARTEASEAMEFEQAAALHTRYERVKAAAHIADPLVRTVPQLRAVLTLPAAKLPGGQPEDAALFLLARGCLLGPVRLSTLGVRAVKEQTSVGSSLFAQPLMLAAVPLDEPLNTAMPSQQTTVTSPPHPVSATLSPERRAEQALAVLEAMAVRRCGKELEHGAHAGSASGASVIAGLASATAPGSASRASSATDESGGGPQSDTTLVTSILPASASTSLHAPANTTDLATLGDHLALLRRWYYRPEKQRVGELLLPQPDGCWPIRQVLRAAARTTLGDPKRIVHADDAGNAMAQMPEGTEFKLLHAGRPGVERAVPVVKGRRRRGAVTPQALAAEQITE